MKPLSVPRVRSTRRALADAALALLAACAAAAMFLPPLAAATMASPTTALAAGLAGLLALVLHTVSLGIAARRLGSSAAGWVALSLGLFPLGGLAALLLLATQLRGGDPHPAAAAR